MYVGNRKITTGWIHRPKRYTVVRTLPRLCTLPRFAGNVPIKLPTYYYQEDHDDNLCLQGSIPIQMGVQ